MIILALKLNADKSERHDECQAYQKGLIVATGLYEFILLSLFYFHLVDGDVIHSLLGHSANFIVNDYQKDYANTDLLLQTEAQMSKRIYLTYALLIGQRLLLCFFCLFFEELWPVSDYEMAFFLFAGVILLLIEFE